MHAFPVAVTQTLRAHHKSLQVFLYQAGCEGEINLMHQCPVRMSTHTRSAASAGTGVISRAVTASFIQCHLFSHSHITPSTPTCDHLHVPSRPIPSRAAWCPKARSCQHTRAQLTFLPAAASPALLCPACAELLFSLCPSLPCCCPPQAPHGPTLRYEKSRDQARFKPGETNIAGEADGGERLVWISKKSYFEFKSGNVGANPR